MTTSPDSGTTESLRPDPQAQKQLAFWRVLSLFVVTMVWLAAWSIRHAFASPNVDDYFYTLLARQLWLTLSVRGVWAGLTAVLNTGPYAPVILALAAPIGKFGPDIAVFVQLPFVWLLTILVFSIVGRFTNPRTACLASLMTTLCPPVLGWSVMVHMAVASTTATVGVVHAYLRSEGFQRRGASVAVGLWLGLLALSRTVAVTHVAALLFAVVLTNVFYRRAQMFKAPLNLLLAAGAAICVAGPWFIVSGLKTRDYLLSYGFSQSVGFLQQGNPVWLRLQAFWGGMGYALGSWILLVGVVAATAASTRATTSRGSRVSEARFLLCAFAVCTLAILSISNTPGTAFDLPVVAALISATVLSLPPSGWRLNFAAALGGLVLGLSILQVVLLPGWYQRSLAAPPPEYAAGIVSATSSTTWRSERVTGEFAGIIGGGDVFVTRDDALLNVNGLGYFKATAGVGGTVGAASYNPDVTKVTVPDEYEFVVTGKSCAGYHRNKVDRDFLESSLRAALWTVALSLRISSCNELVLWRRP